MDNVQETAPLGQAVETPDVQNVEASTEVQQPTQEVTSFEALAAKKGFQTPDDLAKAYANLESQATKANMTNAELEKLFFQAQQAQQGQSDRQSVYQTPQTQSVDQQALAELDKYLDQKWGSKEQSLRSEFKQELDKRELTEVLKESPDFAKYASDVKEMKSKYPNMSFKEAYMFAKASKGDSIQEARSQGMKEGATYLQKQSQAQVTPAKGAAETKRAPVDEILQNAGNRWRPNAQGQISPQAIAERKMVEREIFGRELADRV